MPAPITASEIESMILTALPDACIQVHDKGTIIGVLGTIVGATLGTTASYFLDRYRLITIPSDVYQVSYLPFKLLPWDLATVVVAAIVVCFVATLYPSRQASRLDPAQALRYE